MISALYVSYGSAVFVGMNPWTTVGIATSPFV